MMLRKNFRRGKKVQCLSYSEEASDSGFPHLPVSLAAPIGFKHSYCERCGLGHGSPIERLAQSASAAAKVAKSSSKLPGACRPHQDCPCRPTPLVSYAAGPSLNRKCAQWGCGRCLHPSQPFTTAQAGGTKGPVSIICSGGPV